MTTDQGGVDLSTIPRGSLYARPRTPTVIGRHNYSGGARPATPESSARTPTRIPTTTKTPSFAYTSSARRHHAQQATGTTPTLSSNAGRKRSRLSTTSSGPAVPSHTSLSGHRSTTPSTTRLSARQSVHSTTPLSPGDDYATASYVSPAPLANSKYHLAGGFDTPTAVAAEAYDVPTFSVEANDRVRLFRRLRDDELDRPTFSSGLYAARDVAGPLAPQRNGPLSAQDRPERQFWDNDTLASSYSDTQGAEGDQWSIGRALFNTVTAAAGVVFHFCTANTFKGFMAGGGQGWIVGSDGQAVRAESQPAANGDEASALGMDDSWQDADYFDKERQDRESYNYFDSTSAWPPPYSPGGTPGTPPRAAKKVKTGATDDSGLRNNWILVDGQDGVSRSASPSSASPAGLRRKTAMGFSPGAGFVAGSPFSSRRRRFTATLSTPIGSGGIARQASSATLRSGEMRSNRMGEISNGSPSVGLGASGRRSRAGSIRQDSKLNINKTPKHKRTSSGDGTATASDSAAKAAKANKTPLGKEGDRLIRMRQRIDRDEDRELNRMNLQLEEMIRQGREALGTRFEVELEDDDAEDGGYADRDMPF